MSTTVYTSTLECFNDCGAVIAITVHDKRGSDYLDAMAEAAGWATVDVGKKQEAVCPECINSARQIVKSVGMGKR